MARIRTIKPDFWTDDKLTECSLSARLLFIGTWNFADDNGNLDRSAKQIKARVFPVDNIDCGPLLAELITQGLLIEYSVSGKNYLHIHGFAKHQLINRPSKPTCPAYDESLNTHGVLTESSLPTHDGREGKGREGIEALSGNPDPVPAKPKKQTRTIEAEKVLAHLNDVCGSRFKPVPANLSLITARLAEGATVDEMKSVINCQNREWSNDDTMRKYLRPKTLFNATNYASYQGASAAQQTKPAITLEQAATRKAEQLTLAREAYRQQEAA